MIVDRHFSYVSTKFIKFTQANKIICLCLLLYLTHLLQSLDVGVFVSLMQNYKKLLSKKTCFITYNIDKADFISLIQKARQQVITSQNIESAWRATGLIPYNPTVVFQKFLVHLNNTSTSTMDNNQAGLSTPL